MSDGVACACCGRKAAPMAMVSDPWLDTCFYVCEFCIAPIHEAWSAELGRRLGRSSQVIA